MKNSPRNRRTIAYLATSLILLYSCSKSDNPSNPSNPSDASACKDRPALIGYGRDSFEIKYNTGDKPINIITTIYTLTQQGPLSLKTTYTLEYNAQGNPTKLSRSSAGLDKYYQLDYNANGQLIKQTEYDKQGVSHVYTTAEYGSNGSVTKITTHIDTLASDVSSEYEYANGNLAKKSVKNLYDQDTKGFYDADFTYTYYQDQEIKIHPFFTGPLGLQFMADYAGSPFIQYLPDGGKPQLLYMQETSAGKNTLKNIEVIAYRYNTTDTTHINYTYEYDKDGLPTLQQGASTHIIRRSEPTPFGVPILIETPYNASFTKTMNYWCQ